MYFREVSQYQPDQLRPDNLHRSDAFVRLMVGVVLGVWSAGDGAPFFGLIVRDDQGQWIVLDTRPPMYLHNADERNAIPAEVLAQGVVNDFRSTLIQYRQALGDADAGGDPLPWDDVIAILKERLVLDDDQLPKLEPA